MCTVTDGFGEQLRGECTRLKSAVSHVEIWDFIFERRGQGRISALGDGEMLCESGWVVYI